MGSINDLTAYGRPDPWNFYGATGFGTGGPGGPEWGDRGPVGPTQDDPTDTKQRWTEPPRPVQPWTKNDEEDLARLDNGAKWVERRHRARYLDDETAGSLLTHILPAREDLRARKRAADAAARAAMKHEAMDAAALAAAVRQQDARVAAQGAAQAVGRYIDPDTGTAFLMAPQGLYDITPMAAAAEEEQEPIPTEGQPWNYDAKSPAGRMTAYVPPTEPPTDLPASFTMGQTPTPNVQLPPTGQPRPTPADLPPIADAGRPTDPHQLGQFGGQRPNVQLPPTDGPFIPARPAPTDPEAGGAAKGGPGPQIEARDDGSLRMTIMNGANRTEVVFARDTTVPSGYRAVQQQEFGPDGRPVQDGPDELAEATQPGVLSGAETADIYRVARARVGVPPGTPVERMHPRVAAQFRDEVHNLTTQAVRLKDAEWKQAAEAEKDFDKAFDQEHKRILQEIETWQNNAENFDKPLPEKYADPQAAALEATINRYKVLRRNVPKRFERPAAGGGDAPAKAAPQAGKSRIADLAKTVTDAQIRAEDDRRARQAPRSSRQ